MKIIIVAGGTGGHLYPGVALARALSGHNIFFAVRRGDLGRDILEKEGFPVYEIAGQGLPRRISLKSFTFPFKFIQGWFQSQRLLRSFKPDWVVGMGGYLSVPMILTAKILGIKTLLHEQNVFPGLANRFLSRWADSVAISFPASLSYFKKEKVWVSGLPIRPDIGQADRTKGLEHFGLKSGVQTFLVFGGSLGARHVNTAVTGAWTLLLKQRMSFQVIHITGSNEFERVSAMYRDLSLTAKVLPYCHDMALVYAASDAIICRAGASTIAELLVVKIPALVVPYPYASNDHQDYNAQVLESAGLAKIVKDDALNPERIVDFLVHFKIKNNAHDSDLIDPRQASARLARFLL